MQKIYSWEDFKFQRNYDYITVNIQTWWINNTIDYLEIWQFLYSTTETNVCTDLTEEAKENIWTWFIDWFKKIDLFDVSDCQTTLSSLTPSCLLANLWNLVWNNTQNETIKEWIFWLWNIINYSIPVDYEVTYSLPNWENWLFWDFQKETVDLSNTNIPSWNIEYINDDDKVQLIYQWNVIYTNEKWVFAKFFDIFIPILLALLYLWSITIIIWLLLLPIWWIYKILEKLLDIIVPDIKSNNDKNWNLISIITFIIVQIPLYGLFIFILSKYIQFFPDISYEIRGFIWNFFVFLIEIFHFDFDLVDFIKVINDSLYFLIWSIILHRLITKFWRLN